MNLVLVAPRLMSRGTPARSLVLTCIEGVHLFAQPGDNFFAQVVTLGRSVYFCCGVTGKPAPTVEWFLNGERLNDSNPNNKNWKRHALNSTLVLTHVSTVDLGSYSCKASNTHGSHLSASATLKVFGE